MAGEAAVMEMLAPLGPVYQAGTLSGNPLAMAAGMATVGYLMEHAARVYPWLEKTDGGDGGWGGGGSSGRRAWR